MELSCPLGIRALSITHMYYNVYTQVTYGIVCLNVGVYSGIVFVELIIVIYIDRSNFAGHTRGT